MTDQSKPRQYLARERLTEDNKRRVDLLDITDEETTGARMCLTLHPSAFNGGNFYCMIKEVLISRGDELFIMGLGQEKRQVTMENPTT